MDAEMSSTNTQTMKLRSPKAPRPLKRDASESTATETATKRLKLLLDRLDKKFDTSQPGHRTSKRATGENSERLLRDMEAEIWDSVPNVLLPQARFRTPAMAGSEKQTASDRRASPGVDANRTRIKCSRCPSIFDDERTLKLHEFAKHRVVPPR